MILALRNLPAALMGIAAASLVWWLILQPIAVRNAVSAARAEVVQGQLEAAITEMTRQRESVRAVTASLQRTLSAIRVQTDAARAGLEQEIQSYELARDTLTAGCVLSDADAAWLRTR